MTNCSFNSKTVREWSWVSLDERWTLVPSGLGFSLMMIILRSVTQRDYQRNKSCDKVLISATEVGVCSCVCVCLCLQPHVMHVFCCVFLLFQSSRFWLLVLWSKWPACCNWEQALFCCMASVPLTWGFPRAWSDPDLCDCVCVFILNFFISIKSVLVFPSMPVLSFQENKQVTRFQAQSQIKLCKRKRHTVEDFLQ